MKKVLLATHYEPQCGLGNTERHYGIPFTAELSGREDAKGRPVLCLTAELDDEYADAMIAADRVELIEYDDADKAAGKARADKATAKK